MKLKALPIFLLLPTLMLLLAACGEASEPTLVAPTATPDIEATIQARLTEARIEATVQARLEEDITADAMATAEAVVEATVTAWLTATPSKIIVPTTHTQQNLTEKQVIDIFVTELDEITIQDFGCFLECEGTWGKPAGANIDDREWEHARNLLRYHESASTSTPIQIAFTYHLQWHVYEGAAIWKDTWTAEYVGDWWWLISAKDLGYWLLNEEQEWVMTCVVFEAPKLLKYLYPYITTNAPNAESTCKQAVASDKIFQPHRHHPSVTPTWAPGHGYY